MKKLLLLITALLAGVSGAWAETSTIYLGSSSNIKTNGTFYLNGNAVGAGNWCESAVVAPITLAGSISSSSGYIDAGTTYGSSTLTISVPSGLTISSYSIGLKLTGTTTACTAGGDVTLNNSSANIVSASGINAQSASIAFSKITEDSNKECLIEITDLSIVIDGFTFTHKINAANGTFYSGSTEKTWTSGDALFGNKWLSSATNPQLTFYCGNSVGNGSNNIIIDANFRIHTDTYTLSVPGDRYRIKGYVITGYTGSGKGYTITPNGQSAKSISTNSEQPTTIYVDGLNATTTSFTVGGSATGTPWIYITSFGVIVEDLLLITNTALDALAGISVYSTAATEAKTTVSSLNTIAEIENTVNSVVDINVALSNCNTTDPVKYLATTGANITGSNFSSDAAWKLKGYNAETGTFKLYNEAHETYMGTLPSTFDTAASATTDASSAGVYTITVTDEEGAGGAGKVVFHQPSFGTYYECIHYQSANSIAVRWAASAKASQWDAVKVCSLTYNHYKIADANNPSSEGATLLSSTTVYYISGTNIEFADPFAGLNPVTSLNSKPSDGAINSDMVVNYYYENDATLPFTTSTITNGELDNPTWYYIQVNGLAAYASDNKMKVDGSQTGLNYERWCFVGDAIYGVQIFAESKGVAYPLNIATMANNDNVQLTSTSANTRWFVSGNELNNLRFYQKNGENYYYLNQLGGSSNGGDWSWKVGLWSSGSTINLSATSSNMPEGWAIEAVNYIPTQNTYTNANTLGWPSSTALSTLNAAIVAFGMATSFSNYSALLNAWNTYQTTTDITTPAANTFWRINSVSNANASLQAANGGTRMKFTTTKDKETIFLYDGSHLISYSKGLAINNVREMGNVGVAGNTFAFVKALNGNFGQFSIKCNDGSNYNNNYLYSTGENDSNADRNTQADNFNVNNSFTIEAVPSLPVTFYGQYASFCSPVDLEIPDGVKVYTGTLSSDKLILNEVTTGTLPHATGVILEFEGYSTEATEAENTKEFNILSTITDGTSDLLGTTAAQSIAANSKLVLGKSGDDWGIYKYSGTTLGGFKAYMDMPAGGSVKGFAFSKDDADAVVNIFNGEQNAKEVYDLSGRQVSKPTRGLYIVNGKTMVVK